MLCEAVCRYRIRITSSEPKDGSMGYRWIARSRPDVQWHSMISREDLESLAPPFVLANWVPMPIQAREAFTRCSRGES